MGTRRRSAGHGCRARLWGEWEQGVPLPQPCVPLHAASAQRLARRTEREISAGNSADGGVSRSGLSSAQRAGRAREERVCVGEGPQEEHCGQQVGARVTHGPSCGQRTPRATPRMGSGRRGPSLARLAPCTPTSAATRPSDSLQPHLSQQGTPVLPWLLRLSGLTQYMAGEGCH